MLSVRGEPLLIAAWKRVLMIHFEVDAEALQRDVPFQLDLRDGRAFVSVVAFTMRGMRPRFGGNLAAWLCRPIATHEFLNVRTYVTHDGETGIHFLAEWLSNRLAVKLGPRTFGLPYRHGRITYEHEWQRGTLRGRVTDAQSEAVFDYYAELDFTASACGNSGRFRNKPKPQRAGPEAGAPHRAEAVLGAPIAIVPCERGSLDEWLMERYTAFNSARGRKRFFRVWHPPWPQCPARVVMKDKSLLTQNWPWFREAKLIGANFSPGFEDVWMGRPHSLKAE